MRVNSRIERGKKMISNKCMHMRRNEDLLVQMMYIEHFTVDVE